MKQSKSSANEMRFIGPRSHLEEEHPVDMVALNLTNRTRKDAGPLGGLREQYEQVRGKVGELDNIGNLGAQLSFEQRETLIYFEEIVSGAGGGIWDESDDQDDDHEVLSEVDDNDRRKHKSKNRSRKSTDKNYSRGDDRNRSRFRNLNIGRNKFNYLI